MKDQERLAALESQMSTLVNSQKEFTSKALQMLALGTKNIYSKEEAALFLNLDPDYLYQLKHHGKLKAYKKKGQKKIYFRKEGPAEGHQRPYPEAVPSRLQTFGDHQQTED